MLEFLTSQDEGIQDISIADINKIGIDFHRTSIRADSSQAREESMSYYFNLIAEGKFDFRDRVPKVVRTEQNEYLATDWHLVFHALWWAQEKGVVDPNQKIAIEIVNGDIYKAIELSCQANVDSRPLSLSDRIVAYCRYLEVLYYKEGIDSMRARKLSGNKLAKEIYKRPVDLNGNKQKTQKDEIAPRILSSFYYALGVEGVDPPEEITRELEYQSRAFLFNVGLDEPCSFSLVLVGAADSDRYQVRDFYGNETAMVPRHLLFPLDIKVRKRTRRAYSSSDEEDDKRSKTAKQYPDDDDTSEPQWRPEEDSWEEGETPTDTHYKAHSQPSSGDMVSEDTVRKQLSELEPKEATPPPQEESEGVLGELPEEVANYLQQLERQKQAAEQENEELRQQLEQQKQENKERTREIQQRDRQIQELHRQSESLQQQLQEYKDNFKRLNDQYEREVSPAHAEIQKLRRKVRELEEQLDYTPAPKQQTSRTEEQEKAYWDLFGQVPSSVKEQSGKNKEDQDSAHPNSSENRELIRSYLKKLSEAKRSHRPASFPAKRVTFRISDNSENQDSPATKYYIGQKGELSGVTGVPQADGKTRYTCHLILPEANRVRVAVAYENLEILEIKEIGKGDK